MASRAARSAIPLLAEPTEIRILHLLELADLGLREPPAEIQLLDGIVRTLETRIAQRLGRVDAHAAVGHGNVADLELGRLERLPATVLVVDDVVAPRRGAGLDRIDHILRLPGIDIVVDDDAQAQSAEDA